MIAEFESQVVVYVDAGYMGVPTISQRRRLILDSVADNGQDPCSATRSLLEMSLHLG